MSNNATLDTITDYINDCRTLLLDKVPPYRYDDPSLVIAMNVTLLEARRLRADIFVYNRLVNGQRVPSFLANDGTKLVMEEQFRLAILHGMMGHALQRDQEDIQDERAGAYMKIFSDMLLGVRPSTISSAQQPGG
jgi:hypothetical protein